MTRHMFAGATSPIGFIDYFDHIMPLAKAKRRYYLKGSSGSGKSTFMKKAAKALEYNEFDTEQFHCSNDAQSLDAVAVNSRGLCILDATAPHSRDPQVPGGIDQIVDFAQFLDEGQIAKHAALICELMRVKKLLSDKAAGYFSALGRAFDAEESACEATLIRTSLDKLTHKWVKVISEKSDPGRMGFDRKMFLTALTPEGPVSFAGDGFFDGCTVYGLSGKCGVGTGEFLARLRSEANSMGINTESSYSPLAPKRLEYLGMPGSAFVVTNGVFEYKGKVDERIELDSCIDTRMLSYTRFDTGGIMLLMGKTMELMRESKSVHSKIEEIYAKAMDFDKADAVCEGIIEEILAFL